MPERLLGQLYSSPRRDLAEALTTMPGLQRARLALFCNRRAHLHEMGLSIAATCSEADLTHEGAAVGAMLFRQSRESAGQSREHNPQSRRRPISLATMAPSIAMHDFDDDEVIEADDGSITLVDAMEQSTPRMLISPRMLMFQT